MVDNGAYGRQLAQASVEAGPEVAVIVGAILLAAVLCLATLRHIALGQQLVVFRAGRVIAVRGPGLAVVIPGLHYAVKVPSGPNRFDLTWTEAITKDGVVLAISGSFVATVTDAAVYADTSGAHGDALSAVVETEIRKYVVGADLETIYMSTEDDRGDLAARVTERVHGWGCEVTTVEFAAAQARVSADLIRWAENLKAGTEGTAKMHIDRTTVPGTGVLQQCHTDGGQRFGMLAEHDGRRRLLVYGSADLDAPSQTIVLEPHEADQLAELLHSQSIDERLVALERRLEELATPKPRAAR